MIDNNNTFRNTKSDQSRIKLFKSGLGLWKIFSSKEYSTLWFFLKKKKFSIIFLFVLAVSLAFLESLRILSILSIINIFIKQPNEIGESLKIKILKFNLDLTPYFSMDNYNLLIMQFFGMLVVFTYLSGINRYLLEVMNQSVRLKFLRNIRKKVLDTIFS